jgi:hypothetical protein
MSCSVYVGGMEVNDFNMTEKEAFNLAGEFLLAGYDDIYISVENLSNGAFKWINYSEVRK